MPGILPYAESRDSNWARVANEIHGAIWDKVGVEIVRGHVREWAAAWNAAAQCAQANQNEEWQTKLPALSLPLTHESRSAIEKWASLAAIHDVYDRTGDKVLPWPLPEDDRDLQAYTDWLNSDGGAYQVLLRAASKLMEADVEPVRQWLRDITRDMRKGEPETVSQSAMKAVIETGMAGIMRLAASTKSADQISAIMGKRWEDEPETKGWSADRWVNELGCAKKTIIGNKPSGVPPCDAWAERMAWKESNKQARKRDSVS